MFLMPVQFNSSARQQKYLRDIRSQFVSSITWLGQTFREYLNLIKNLEGARTNYLGKQAGHDDIMILDEREKKAKFGENDLDTQGNRNNGIGVPKPRKP